MAESLSFELVTPLGIHKGEDIGEIVVPAQSGEMCILPGHDVMILTLGVGAIIVSHPDSKETFFVSRGYVQIDSDRVRILAEVCETPDQIDAQRAEQARDRAEKRLKENASDLDWLRAEAALTRAVQRLNIVNLN